jgi:hypothetical protein
MDHVLRGAREVADEWRDDYFAYVSAALRFVPNPTVFDIKEITRNGVRMFRAGRPECIGCDG